MYRRMTLVLVLAVSLLGLLTLTPATARAAAREVGPERVYFPQTGHYLAYGFLNYWRLNGGLSIFGFPITEEMTQDGRTVQYFERARLEWWPEHRGTPYEVQGTLLGSERAAGRGAEPPFRPIANAQPGPDRDVFPQTGHTLAYGFRAYWHANGGLPIFGYPISEEFNENGRTVQYFERARFEWFPEHRGTRYEVQLGLLGTWRAQRDGVNRAAVPPSNDVPAYDPGLWYVPTTSRAPLPGAPIDHAKWIEIDLSEQHLWAWTYRGTAFDTPISTGTPDHPTPAGAFTIYSKLRYDDMTGGTPGVDYYNLPDVPWVMYFYQAYAIHGAYWHNNFGHTMSHGCVNLPLPAAEWLYNWTPLGTTVWIHQ